MRGLPLQIRSLRAEKKNLVFTFHRSRLCQISFKQYANQTFGLHCRVLRTKNCYELKGRALFGMYGYDIN